MKKLLTLAIFMGISVTTFSTTFDIIVTTDEQKIEAQIMEVSQKDIKYKESDNLEGPLFVLPTNDISSIIFSNGQVKVYEHSQSSMNLQQETPPSEMIVRTGNSYYYKGEEMRGKKYKAFLENNCAEAYNLYRTGYVQASVGWSLFACGLFLDLGFAWWRPAIGFIGLAFEIACIPTLCADCNVQIETQFFWL